MIWRPSFATPVATLFVVLLVAAGLVPAAAPIVKAQGTGEPGITFECGSTPAPCSAPTGTQVTVHVRQLDFCDRERPAGFVLVDATGKPVGSPLGQGIVCFVFDGTFTIPTDVPPGSYHAAVVHPNGFVMQTSRQLLTVTGPGGGPGLTTIEGRAECFVDGDLSAYLPFALVRLYSGTALVAETRANADGFYRFERVATNATFQIRYISEKPPVECGTAVTTGDDPRVPPPPYCPDQAWDIAAPLTSGVSSPDSICKANHSIWRKISIAPGEQINIQINGATARTRVALFNDLKQDFNEMLSRPDNVDVRQLDASISGPTSAPWDSAPWDSAPWDSAPWDSAPWDSAPWDSAPWDSAPWDSAPWDSAKLCADAGVDPNKITDEACAGAYVTAQMRNLLAFSTNGQITRNTWDNTGDYYLRVYNADSSFDPTQQLGVVATVIGTCGVPPHSTPGQALVKVASSFLSPTGGTTLPGGATTLIFTHTGRITGANGLPLSDITNAAQRTAFFNTLTTFAQHGSVKGVVVDFANDVGMLANYTQWDKPPFPSCPAAANIVAEAMHDVINAYRQQSGSSLQYVTILGGHTVVPYRLVPDHAELEQEKRYNPGLLDLSKSATTLASSYVMTDNYYISFSPVKRLESEISLPDENMAVGRLVEFADDITNALQAFIASNGVMRPTAAIATGYTFMTDFATAEANVLAASGISDVDKTLISDTWTAPDLKGRLFDPDRDGVTQPNFDILAINWHARSNEAAAADYATNHPSVVKSSDIANFTDDDRFRNALVISLGCHLAHPLINGDVIQNPSAPPQFVTDARAFTETFLNKGAFVLGNTGYGYGDTDFVAYGERLIVDVTQEFRYFDVGTTPEPVPVGKALTRAKRNYVNGMSSLTGVDKKTVEQLTFYGPPMWAIDVPNRVARPAPPVINPSLVVADDGLGLLSGIVSPAFNLNRRTLGDGTYFEADSGGIQQLPFRQVLPYTSFELNAGAGRNARGVALISADYVDSTTQAAVSLPATEVPGQRPPWVARGFWPSQTYGLNHLTESSLSVTPVQWKSTDGTTGTSRQYPNAAAQNLRLYYSTATGGAVFAGPASLRDVSVRSITPTRVRVEVTVNGASITDIFDVLVNYTATQGSLNTHWQSCSLVPLRSDGPATTKSCLNAQPPELLSSGLGWFIRRYAAEFETTGTGASPADLRFGVHSVTGTGLVSTRTNDGNYFRLVPENVDAANPKAHTAITLGGPPPITYNTQATFTARLTADRDRCKPGGQTLSFTLGSQTRTGTTDGAGSASVTFNVLAIPDDYVLTVSLAETVDCLPSSAQKDARVVKKNTSLTFGTTPYVVTLKDADGQLMREQYVFFTVKNATRTVTRSALTDARGVAQLRDLQLPTGTYTLTASFPGTIPTATGTIQLVDERYNPAPPISKSLTVDTRPPSCDITATGVDTNRQAYIKVTVRDTGSGLANVSPTELTNATLTLSNPTYAPGTTSAIVVTATKIDQSKSAVLALEVFDVAGNVTHCEPVMVTVGRGEDLPRVFRTEIPAEEVFVTVINGEPGVNNIKLKVNKTLFEVNDLEDGERRHLNIAKAMRKRTNRVTISARGGKRGASAVIITSDVPTP